MEYQYPEHFNYPPNERVYFADHVNTWEHFFSHMKNKPNVCLEIGALYGGSSVYMIEEFCKMEGSHHYIMDINFNEYLQRNVYPYGNKVSCFIGESADSFKRFEHDGRIKEFLDFVYIDGNHMSRYVLEDAVNSFYCLKNDGIMVFDDFGGGLEQDRSLRVETAVDSFLHSYEKYVNIIYDGYQLILQKVNYVDEINLKSNYYKI